MSVQPNVLFILSDQHNAKVLGCKDHPDVLTPNLDRMAEQGVRFENAITQNPICTPSRMCYLSGQYVHNHGYYGLSGPNPGGLPTLLGHFRRAGYRTAAIGKIHCPEYWIEDDSDVFHETCNCSIGGRSRTYTQFLEARGVAHLEDHIGLTEFGARGRQSMEGRPSPLTFDESQEGWIANTAIEVMRDAVQAGQPFFVHASPPRPHQCTAPCQEFWDLYSEDEITLPPNADDELAGKAPHFIHAVDRWRRGDWTLYEPHTFEAGRLRKLHGYLGAVSQVDHAVGRLIDYLREAGLLENTIVVYSADHGDYAAEHGIMEKAPGICSDAITRIPHIWLWKGHFETGHVAEEIVETVDMSNTLCALAGLDPMETSDGADISRLLRGESGDVHRIGVTEFAWSKSVRKGRYRYVYYAPQMFPEEYPDGNFGELYDLEADPWEMNNLYYDPGYTDVIRELKDDLTAWLITTTRIVHTNGVPTFVGDQWVTRYRHSVNADGKIHSHHLAGLPYGRRNYL